MWQFSRYEVLCVPSMFCHRQMPSKFSFGTDYLVCRCVYGHFLEDIARHLSEFLILRLTERPPRFAHSYGEKQHYFLLSLILRLETNRIFDILDDY